VNHEAYSTQTSQLSRFSTIMCMVDAAVLAVRFALLIPAPSLSACLRLAYPAWFLAGNVLCETKWMRRRHQRPCHSSVG